MQEDVYQRSSGGCAAGKTPLVCGAGCHIHPADTEPGKLCNTRMKNKRCPGKIYKDQHVEKCCLDLLRELRQDLEGDSESLAFEAVIQMERHLEVQLSATLWGFASASLRAKLQRLDREWNL